MNCRICGGEKNLPPQGNEKRGVTCGKCYKRLSRDEYDNEYVFPEMHHRKIAYCMRCGRLLTHHAIMKHKSRGASSISHFEKIDTLPYTRYFRGEDEYVVCESCMKDVVENITKTPVNEFIIKGFSFMFQRYPYERLKQDEKV